MKTSLIHHKMQEEHNLSISFALLTIIVSIISKQLVFYTLFIFQAVFSLQTTLSPNPRIGPIKLW